LIYFKKYEFLAELRNRGAAARDIKSIQDIARTTLGSGDDAVFLEMYNNTGWPSMTKTDPGQTSARGCGGCTFFVTAFCDPNREA
jgi:hypothetical protein